MSAPVMPRMREKVETQLKPMHEMLVAGMLPHGNLLSGSLDLVVRHYEKAFRAMDDPGGKLCWYEFCLTPEIFLAMDIHPFLGEVHPGVMSLGDPELCWEFVDAAEQSGVPSEVCVLDKFMLGALQGGEMPRADFIVTASAPCDSSRTGYQMFERLVDCPVYRLDAPFDDTAEAHVYYGEEIRGLIGFLEERTGRRLDVDRLREVCEESNRATDALSEWFELKRARPCPHPGSLTFTSYMAILSSLGTPELSRYLEFLRDDAAAAVKEGRGAIANEKHRILWYYVPITFDFDLNNWIEERFNAIVLADMLSTFFRQDPIDTTNLDTMLIGLARRGLEATMGRLRVSATTLTERFLRDYSDFGADCVIFPGPVGCKHVWGWVSMLRAVCRDNDIPICVFDLDWMDSRVRPPESIQAAIEQFFDTVM